MEEGTRGGGRDGRCRGVQSLAGVLRMHVPFQREDTPKRPPRSLRLPRPLPTVSKVSLSRRVVTPIRVPVPPPGGLASSSVLSRRPHPTSGDPSGSNRVSVTHPERGPVRRVDVCP